MLDRKRSQKKMVVFIDEMPWLDTAKSGFMSAFEHSWNDWGSAKHNLLLIVCGSATTFHFERDGTVLQGKEHHNGPLRSCTDIYDYGWRCLLYVLL